MFKVAFTKYVFDADHDDPKARFAVLLREEYLPFPPVPGHEINWPLIRRQKITSSTWNTEHQGFTCRLEDEYTVNLDPDAPDFDEAIELASDEGWTVSSIYPKS